MRAFRDVEAWLAGKPNDYLTLALIAAGLVFIAIALFAPATVKALALAYAVFP